jgi:hypothetical protein
MLSEDSVSHLLRERADQIDVPIERIVAGSVVRGRRLRRRRTARRIISGTGVAVGAVALGAVALGSGGPEPSPQRAAPLQVGTPVPTQHRFGVAADQTSATLKSLLPAGSASAVHNESNAPQHTAPPIHLNDGTPVHSLESGATAAYRQASLLFDDGHGAGLVRVNIGAPDPAGKPTMGTIDLSSAMCHDPGISCRAVTGGVLVTETTESPGSTSEGVASASAIYQSDGWTVTVTAYNATAEKGGIATRSTPVLTSAQLDAIATYAGWLK